MSKFPVTLPFTKMSQLKLEESADGFRIKRNHKTTDLFSLEEAGGMFPIYKLTYFQDKALAEPAKYLMKYGGIDFEEMPNDDETSSIRDFPISREYNQSMAVARFFAKQVDLIGNDALEDYAIDSIVDTINDLRINISSYYYEKDSSLKGSLKVQLFEKALPFYCEWLEKAAEINNGYLACKKLTWADMYFVSLLPYMRMMTGTDIISKYPKLQMVEKHVLSIAAISNWLKTRPKVVLSK